MTYTMFRANLIKKHAEGQTWKQISADLNIPVGTICRIALDSTYRPRSRSLRLALGLCGKRRKYDRSTRELREIGIDILRILYGGIKQ